MMTRSHLRSVGIGLAALLGALAVPCLLAQNFRNPYRIPTPVDPASVIAGDLNSDLLPDLIWGDSSGPLFALHVLLAQPSGGYLPGQTVTLPAAVSSPPSCVLADVTNDRTLDLICVAALNSTDTIYIFVGNGDGTFQPPVITPSQDPYPNPRLFLAGDLNHDKIPDFFVESSLGESDVLLSNGLPSQLSNATPPGEPFTVGNIYVPTFADINGDGLPDLLASAGPFVRIDAGSGVFNNQALGASYNPNASCVFRDFDGDGLLDALCGFEEAPSGISDLALLKGLPNGAFNTTHPLDLQYFGNRDTFRDALGTFVTPIASGDFNGDGIPDVLAQSGDGLAVLFGSPGLHFSTPLHYAQAIVGNAPSILGFDSQSVYFDMNHDGRPDIVACGPNGLYITYARPDGTFSSALAPEVTESIAYTSVFDFDGDGFPDVVATGDTAIKFSHGNGDGTFAPPVALPSGSIDFSGTNSHILHGDFNGDGKQDLLALITNQGTQANTYLLYGHGNGTFDAPLQISTSSTDFFVYSPFDDASVYDINHDGLSDILTVSTNAIALHPQIISALSNGKGAFTSVGTTYPGDSAGNGFLAPITFPVLADFSHRGQFDVVYGSRSNVFILQGHGDGSFDTTGLKLPIPTLSGQPSLGSIAVAIGDFDGDKNLDFALLVQYGAGQFPTPSPLATAAWVYFGDGAGGFSTPVLAGVFNRNYTGITAYDLNGDGLADLVLKTSGSAGGGHAVGIVHAAPSRTFTCEINYTAGTGLSNLSITDLNKDGLPDLLFANGDPGIAASSVTVLLNEGLTQTLTGVLGAAPEPSPFGAAFNISATLAPPNTCNALTGDVAFTIDGKPLGSAPLNKNIAAIIGPSTLSVGPHQLTATWPGDSDYSPLTLTDTHYVASVNLTGTLIASPEPSSSGQPFTLTAAYTPLPGTIIAGSVIFSIDGTMLGSATILNNAATIAGPTNLSAGPHQLSATWVGNATYNSLTLTGVHKIQQNNLILKFSSEINPSNIGQSVPFDIVFIPSPAPPSGFLYPGTIQLYEGSSILVTQQPTVSGNALTLHYAGLTSGLHNLSAFYTGDSIYPAASSNVVQQNVTGLATTDTLTVTPSSGTSSTIFLATATVQPNVPGPVPTGKVTFTVTTPPSTIAQPQRPVTLSTSATASQEFTDITSPFIVGCIYAGDSNYAGGNCNNVSINVNTPADFTLTGPSAITFPTESSGSAVLTLTSLNSFSGPVALSCNLPQPTTYTCALSPATPSLAANGTAASALAIHPVLSAATSPANPSRIFLATLCPLALLLFARRRRHRLAPILTLALLAILTTALTACGSDVYTVATRPGSYPLTVTATGTASGTPTPTTRTLALNVVITP